MAYITMPLLIITILIMASVYLGVWANVVGAFSDERIRNDMIIASRINEYDRARFPAREEAFSALDLLKQSERLSERQREVFREILDNTNRDIAPKFLLILFLLAWGSIYLTHKVVGPLYRFGTVCDQVDRGDFRARARLRKGDEAQQLASRLNQTLEHLDGTLSRLKEIVRVHEEEPEVMTRKLRQELDRLQTSSDG